MNIWQELEMRTRLSYSLVSGLSFMALLSSSLFQMLGAACLTWVSSLVYQYGILMPFLKKASPLLRNRVFVQLRLMAYICITAIIYLVLKIKGQPITDETTALFMVLIPIVILASAALIATICCKRSFDRHTTT
jgi:hypothetical protein